MNSKDKPERGRFVKQGERVALFHEDGRVESARVGVDPAEGQDAKVYYRAEVDYSYLPPQGTAAFTFTNIEIKPLDHEEIKALADVIRRRMRSREDFMSVFDLDPTTMRYPSREYTLKPERRRSLCQGRGRIMAGGTFAEHKCPTCKGSGIHRIPDEH